jgi:hypothetical protein
MKRGFQPPKSQETQRAAKKKTRIKTMPRNEARKNKQESEKKQRKRKRNRKKKQRKNSDNPKTPHAARERHYGAHMPAGTTVVDVGSAADEPSRHTKFVMQNLGCTSVSAKSATISGEPVP